MGSLALQSNKPSNRKEKKGKSEIEYIPIFLSPLSWKVFIWSCVITSESTLLFSCCRITMNLYCHLSVRSNWPQLLCANPTGADGLVYLLFNVQRRIEDYLKYDGVVTVIPVPV